MGKKKQSSSLGKALVKDRFGSNRNKNSDSFLHTSEIQDGYDWGRLNLQSVTEENSLEEFLATAQLAGTEFAAEKMNITFVSGDKQSGLLSATDLKSVSKAQDENKKFLKIPRRPEWDDETTPEELDKNERDSFLDWRRELALLQEKEHIILTPFERNLDFWRQLWRVIERSDVIVQIVDARNPLLYRCKDLETYVKEINPSKTNMILINKADYLTADQRKMWSEYFDKENIKVAFWSAVNENERISKANEDETSTVEDVDNSESNDSESDDEVDTKLNNASCAAVNQDSSTCNPTTSEAVDVNDSDCALCKEGLCRLHEKYQEDTSDGGPLKAKSNYTQSYQAGNCHSLRNNPDLLTGEELLDILRAVHSGQQHHEDYITIGLVGYPNVGKSSTINALLQMKKVPVSSTPGRTKHFQTLFVDKDMMLCDCPGLVMPTFVNTKAHMVINGILPIDQMRDYIPPISLVCQLIPKSSLQISYGILLPKPLEGEDPNRPPTAHELLSAYGSMRGYMSHKGIPDLPRSARCILKDFVNGKLLYCCPPPGISEVEFKSTPEQPCHAVKGSALAIRKLPKGAKPKALGSSDVDQQFFANIQSKPGTKGVCGVKNFQRVETLQQVGEDNPVSSSSSTGSLTGKPWKKHKNIKKKEKLRRIHAALDVHD